MLYNYIKEHYKEAEPIFFSDLEREEITKSALNQQLKKLCDKGLLQKYDTGVYFIPKKSLLNSTIGPNADMVARYRFISKGDNVDGFYGGNFLFPYPRISLLVQEAYTSFLYWQNH